MRLLLNDAGEANGELELWYNGESVINIGGLIIRDSDEGRLRGLMMQTFFGGKGPPLRPYRSPINFDGGQAATRLGLVLRTNTSTSPPSPSRSQRGSMGTTPAGVTIQPRTISGSTPKLTSVARMVTNLRGASTSTTNRSNRTSHPSVSHTHRAHGLPTVTWRWKHVPRDLSHPRILLSVPYQCSFSPSFPRTHAHIQTR